MKNWQKWLTPVIALIAVAAIAFSAVFGTQKADLQKKTDELDKQLATLNAQLETAEKEAADAAKLAEEKTAEAASAADEAAKAAEEARAAKTEAEAAVARAEAAEAAQKTAEEAQKTAEEAQKLAEESKKAAEDIAAAAKAGEEIALAKAADAEAALKTAQEAAEAAKAAAEAAEARAEKAEAIVKTIKDTVAEPAEEPAEPAAEAGLPTAGEVVNGFEAKEIRDFPLIQAKLVLFEHQKTGAKLLYIANEDTNRAFQLTFLTRPTDNTGLPHVFEHSTLSGCEKYPSAALFFNLSSQTYNTYMNAYTTDAMTCYPIASLSEAQLLKYADYYTDSCLHPNVLEKESIFRTEAWRYRLEKAEDPLTLEGTVYSEMQGAMTLNRFANMEAYRQTFPGSVLGNDYGGNPDDIPDMTYESLKNYHSLFYHPSNCLAMLYGKFEDYAAFLSLLDEAFSPYEKSEFHFEDSGYTPITGPVENKVGFPMAEGTAVENQSVIEYYIVCPGMRGDEAAEQAIDNLCLVLSADSSPLAQAVKKALPTAAFSCGRELAAMDDAIVFMAYQVNENDAQIFRETVDSVLREVAANGLDQEIVDGIQEATSLSTRLAPESGDPVEGVMESLAYEYAVTGDVFRYVSNVASLENISAMNADGTYKEAAAKWLADNQLTSLLTVYPEPGQKEVKDAALADKLAEIKAAMSEEELQKLIDETNNKEPDEDASALVAQLQAVTVENLPEEARIYDYSDTADADGVRFVDVTAKVDGIGKTNINLDAQAVPQEDLHWLALYVDLLGRLDTDAHTSEELDALTIRYLYNGDFNVVAYGNKEEFHPYVNAAWTATDENLSAGYDLAAEILFRTKYDDLQKLTEKVQAVKTGLRSEINGSPYSVSMSRGFAVDNARSRYFSYMGYVEYYAFLEQTEAALLAGSGEPAQKLAAVRDFLANKDGAMIGFAGNEKSIELNRAAADAFLAKLKNEKREKVAYDLPVPAVKEAMIADVNVQFNNVFASFDKMGMEDYDAAIDVVSAAVGDIFLTPVLRDQYGVYTAWNGANSRYGMYLITYRDPNVRETFDFYATLADQLSTLEIDQDKLNGYIISSYSGYAKGAGELTGAANAVSGILDNRAQEEVLEHMRQLKAVTPETLKAYAEIYRKAWENGVHSTAGSAAAINANADLYESILNPFNAKDNSQVDFEDVTEDLPEYAAIRWAFENNYMTPVSETVFGAAEQATAGDLLGGIYVGIGGPAGDPAGARDYLAPYGLVPADLDLNTPLTEQFLVDLLNNGFGVGMTTDTPENVMTRAELADLFSQLFAQE